MHRTAVCCAILAAGLLLAGPAGANPAERGLRWAADVPMEDCDGVPCVDARVGQGPIGRAVIDTGNIASAIDSANAPPGLLFGVFEKLARHQFVSTVEIGAAQLHEVPFATLNLNELIAKGEMPRARATLAYTAFKDRILQLDFIEDRVRISPPLTEPVACAQPCAALRLVPFGAKGPEIVVGEGFSANGRTLTAQIDTVFTGGLLVYDASIARLGLTDAAATDHEVDFPYTDGGVRMRIAKDVALIAFGQTPLAAHGPIYFPLPGVHEPDGLFDATAGLDLMRHAVVTLDFHDMTISIAVHPG